MNQAIADLKSSFAGASGVERIAIAKRIIEERKNKAASPETLITAPDGSTDFGEITPDIAKAIGSSAGKIKLQLGTHSDETGRGFGKLHIDRDVRAEQLQANGYQSTEELIFDVAQNKNAIYQGKGDSFIFVKLNGKAKIAFVQVKQGRDGGFYSVGSGLVSRENYLKNKTLLWERAQTNQLNESPSAITGNNKASSETIAQNRDDSKQSVEKENIILSEIIQHQIKDAKRDGYYSSEIQDVADKATLKNINSGLFSHIKKLATAIKNKDSGILIALLANNDNKASQSAFKKITGVNLSGKTSAEKEKLIFDFAKVSEDDINAYHAKKEAEKEADKPQKASKAKHFDSELDDFVSSLDAMQKGRAIKALNSLWQVNKGETDTAKNHIKTMVSSGLATHTEEVSNIKEMSRLKYNRASGEEQDEHERKMKEAGTKTIYYLGNVDVGKIGFDYANYLINKPILDSILDDTTTMQTSIQTLKSQFPANNGMGKIALARQILQARVNQVSKIHGFKKGDSFFKNDLYFQVTGINRGKFVHYDVLMAGNSGVLIKTNSLSLDDNAFYNKFNGFESELPQQELNNAPSTNEILERNSPASRNANSGNEKPVRNDGSANGTNTGTPSATANQAGNQQQGDNRVSTDSPVIAGTQSDSSVVKGNGDYSPPRTVDDTGSGDVSGSGISDDRQRNETVAGIAQGTKKLDRAVKLALQAQAEGIDYEPTEENIRATLPFLLPEQQDDIVKIEARFKENHGMLITNGTGTGKTFTALGAVKRFQKQGKDSILIVVPNDKIGQDFIDSAVNMKLTIKLLDGIKDNGGSGISITTYANFYQNESLLEREFDLVVFDESHKINSNAAGDDTRVQDMMRKVTGHPNDMNRRLEVAKTKEPLKSQFAEIDNKIIAINKKYGNYGTELQERINNGGGYNNVPESAENEKYELRKEILELEKTAKEELLTKRSKVLFLSATPFAYEKSIDYAEGYLFDYNKADGSGYNSGGGYEQFMMANFGGTMRYNKLTRADAGVDTGYMQREFNEKLKKSGALSGRLQIINVASIPPELLIHCDR